MHNRSPGEDSEPGRLGAEDAPEAATTARRFGQRFWPLFLLGLAGIAVLPFFLVPMLRVHTPQLPPGAPAFSLSAWVALSLVNPLLLLTAAVAIGAALAPKLGFRSHVAEYGFGRQTFARLRGEWREAALIGIVVSLLLVGLDALLQPMLGPAWTKAVARLNRESSLFGEFASGLFYGGLTEELMLRWGVLSAVTWVLWRVMRTGRQLPSSGVVLAAVAVSGIVFGLGHLPAGAAIAPLTPMLVLRIIFFNAAAGIAYGLLYWRRSLEAAMVAHASTHVGFALLRLAGLA